MKTWTEVTAIVFFALLLLFIANELLYRNDLLAQDVLASCCDNHQCNNQPCTSASTMELVADGCEEREYTCRDCINAGRQGTLCNEPDADDYCYESDGSTKYLVCPYLSASISGPSQVCVLDEGTYTIGASGGTTPFSYMWYEKDGSGSWYYKGNGSSVEAGDGYHDFYIKCVVTDACGANGGPRTVTPERFIDYVGCKSGSTEDKDDLSTYPNPFNPTGNIRLNLSEPRFVSLAIYSMQGREVRRLLVNQEMSAGHHNVIWDGRNNTGENAASGIYLCRFLCRDVSKTARLLLIR